jgi:hypothetical protein
MASNPSEAYLRKLLSLGRTPVEIATQMKIGLDQIQSLITEYGIVYDNIEDH